MAEIAIHFPVGAFGESNSDTTLDWMLREIGRIVSPDPDGEWATKYGSAFENDVFLMHPYCWCEKEGECPWCTGCGTYEDTCQACSGPLPHAATCYQTEMHSALKAAGLSHILNGKFILVSNRLPYETERKIEGKIYDDLCAKHGLDREFGAAVHCDCGADDKRVRAMDERGCDYHLGKGIFARFSPYGHNRERHYYDPPNFWYKPGNFRVKWYKYIGRDVVTNRDLAAGESLQQIFDACIASLPEPMRTKGK